MSESRSSEEGSTQSIEGMSEVERMVEARNAKMPADTVNVPVDETPAVEELSVENNEEAPSPRNRDGESRESEMRSQVWKPAPLLPQPNPVPGLDHRYVRVSSRGQEDNVNASQAFREGWEAVLSTEYPELKVVSDRNSGYPENVVVGGLLLCARPKSIGKQIEKHASAEARSQMEAVDSNFFRDQDSRMPKLRDRSSRVSEFGDD